MANKISVLIDVTVDRANQALGSFRKSVGDADGAVGKFKAGAASAGDSLKANIMPVAAAAGAALVGFAAKSVQAASQLSESTNAVNVSFGNAADGVLDFGETAAETMGLSKSAFNEAAVGFAAFAESIAGPGGDVAGVIGDITTRASDFASVMNLDVSEAADVFRSSLSGETEPIKKFGIDLSAAAVEAYALASGMVESKDQITEAIKVQARYGLLMQRTEKFAGDFANTSDGLANSSRIAAARFEDLQATIGTKLLPVVEDATGILLGLADAIDDVGNNSVVKFGNDLGVFNNVFGVTKDLWDRGPGSLLKMATGFEEATEAVSTLSSAMVQQSIDSALVERKTLDMAAAEDERQVSLEQSAEAIDNLKTAQDELRQSLEESMQATLASIDSSLGYRNQQADTAQAVRDAAAAMAEAEVGSDEYAQASRDAEAAVLAQAGAALKLAEDQAAANGETLTAQEKAAIYRAELESLAGYLNGPTRTAIDGHIEALGRIPKTIYTDLAVRSTNAAGQRVIGAGGFVAVNPEGAGATGGIVNRPTVALIGEAGPEAVVPLNKTPGNGPLPGGLGGSPINITINAGLGVNGPALGNEIENVLMKVKRRNGKLAWE